MLNFEIKPWKVSPGFSSFSEYLLQLTIGHSRIRSIYTKCSKIFLIQNILQYYNNIKGFTENFDLKLFWEKYSLVLAHPFFLFLQNYFHTHISHKVSAFSNHSGLIILINWINFCIFLNSWTTATAFSLNSWYPLSENVKLLLSFLSISHYPPSLLLLIQKSRSSSTISSSSSSLTSILIKQKSIRLFFSILWFLKECFMLPTWLKRPL